MADPMVLPCPVLLKQSLMDTPVMLVVVAALEPVKYP